jgi:hypothetical protein
MSENYAIVFFIEIVATFIGVIFALALDSRRSRKNYQKRLDEISPYIYMELAENWYSIRFRDSTYFVTNYWEVFREDLGKWNEDQIVKIIRIYNYMESKQTPTIPKYAELTQIENLMTDVLKWFEAKAGTDPDFKKRLEGVQKYFKEMQTTIDKEGLSDGAFIPKYFPRRTRA